jgi:2-phosphoglycolate phosphatase
VIPRFAVYLFDIDGTLVDSAQDICAAMRGALATVAEAPTVTEAYLRSFIGRNMIDLFLEVFPAYDATRADVLFQHYRTCYLERGHRQTRVFPGVAEALRMLPGRKGTATGKGTATTRAVLEMFGLLQHFDHVQGTDGFPGKPEPDVILKSLDALGARPEDCLMVGDSHVDMEAGRRAGVRTCAVRYGYGVAEELTRFGPDFWVDDLRELAGAAKTNFAPHVFSTAIPLLESANSIKTEQINPVETGESTPKIV